MADALRRISVMESQRGRFTFRTIKPIKLANDLFSGSSSSKETVHSGRSVLAARTVTDSSTATSPQPPRDKLRRQGSSTSTIPVAYSRNSIINQSNGSLASDCTSSNSASPAPSPSPTQYRQQQGTLHI